MTTGPDVEQGRRGIGNPVDRREDVPLVRGEAAFTDDIGRPDALYMAVRRSQYGHARLVSVDTDGAEALDGVYAAFTGADVEASGHPGIIAPTSTTASLYGADDPDLPARVNRPLVQPERPFLAGDRVRYTGEPVAAVLAEDRYTARDAVDSIRVEYDPLDSVVEPEAAVTGDAPTIHDDAPDNVAFDWEAGNAGAVGDAVADATHTVSVDIGQQRISPTSIEPRTALAEYANDELTVHVSTQSPHRFRTLLSEALALPEERIRVIAPEVGGAFGAKSKFYTEEPLTAWCALHAGRPVAWQATRSEAFRSDIHGRARTIEGELAFEDDGTITGLRVESHANLGAYVARGAPTTRTGSFVDVLSGQYEIPAIHCRVVGCFTTTSPVDSYRGSSRPMAIRTVEQLVHLAARELGLDPVEVRRRNFVPPDAFPYETPTGLVYDSGEYERAMERALDIVDYEAVRERQAAARDEGTYLGVGVSCTLDNAGTGSTESGRVRFDSSGTVTASVGTADQGQGHRTTFAQLVADLLGVPFDDVEIEEGDTADVPTGGGASGSRSVVCGGEVLRLAARAVVEDARPVAAHRLEASAEDVAFEDGEFFIRGAPGRSVHIQEIARSAGPGASLPEGLDTDLDEVVSRSFPATYPFGTHVAVVEISPETGEISVERYVAVDDCGIQINPKLVEGQVVGSVAQGISQALYEDAVYDDTGTLVTGSLMDYTLPNADQIPEIETDHTVTPSPANELGVKGVGESGTTAAPAAIANAVADALDPLGIAHLDLPITPETVWRAFERAG